MRQSTTSRREAEELRGGRLAELAAEADERRARLADIETRHEAETKALRERLASSERKRDDAQHEVTALKAKSEAQHEVTALKAKSEAASEISEPRTGSSCRTPCRMRTRRAASSRS